MFPRTHQIDGITQETLAAIAKSQAAGPTMSGDILKQDATTTGITTALGVMGYDLESPYKSLFPQNAILPSIIPRIGGFFGNAIHWKAITKINAGKLKAGVAEGVRNSALQTTEVDKQATFKTIGLDDFTNDEAVWMGRQFADPKAMSVANTMIALKLQEDILDLGGNVTAIGKPSATGFTAVDSANAGPFVAATAYDFSVSALTLYGYINGATGHASADAVDETDGRNLTTYTTGGGKTSATLAWAAVRGAVAYNVYIGTHSGTLYYAFTTTQTKITIDSTVLAALPGSGNVPNTADQTADALSYDGLIPQIAVSGNGAYFKDLQGATLTADNAGGVVEWDAALKSIYDATVGVSPTKVLVSSQEAQNALKRIAGAGGSSTSLRINVALGPDGRITGGTYLGSYLNKFSQSQIDIITHPKMPPGNTLFLSEKLAYPNNNVPNVIDIAVLQGITQYDWARVQRRDEYGVYGSQVLRLFFPAGQGLIVGGANG